MKVVIAKDGDRVSEHFGRCPSFLIIESDNGAVTNKEEIANPGHHPGFLPEFFNKKGVGCIIAGGMGPSAVNLFNQYNIEQITGVSGTVDETINAYLNGSLSGGPSFCSPGEGKGYGVDKTTCDHEENTNHDH